jgi:hypothetical protein
MDEPGEHYAKYTTPGTERWIPHVPRCQILKIQIH